MASNFDNFLADFSKSGNRYDAALRLVMSGKATGMSAEDIIDRAHAVGVTNRDADLRRLWNQSKVEPNRHSASWRPSRRSRPAEPPAEPLTQEDRDFVPATLRDYGRTTAFTGTATADIFAEAIRLPDADLRDFDDPHAPINYPKQAARQLRALFRPGDLIWAGTIIPDEADRARLGIRYAKTPIKPAPGDNIFDPAVRAGIIEAHVLADRIEKGIVAKIPTHVSLNPVTGKAAQTSGSSSSYDCAATIAAYRHVIVEWDNLFDLDAQGVKTPSQAHIETVAGLLDYSFETDRFRPLVAVYTGGKSIHVALRVKADDRAAYKRQTDALRDLFASADDETFRADTTGWDNGYTHIRLAGAIRPETGRRARLLWANP